MNISVFNKCAEPQGNKRIATLDIIKGIAILAIILVHIPKEVRLFSTGVSFHVSAFFAVSGVFLFQTIRAKNGAVIRDKTQKDVLRLLYPYFTLSALYVVVHSLLKLVGIYNSGYSLGTYLFLVFSFNGIGTLWFLPVFFLSKLLARITYPLFNKYSFLHRISLVIISIIAIFVASYLCNRGLFGHAYENGVMGFVTNVIITVFESLIACGIMVLGYEIWTFLTKMKGNVGFLTCIMISSLLLNIYFYKYYSGNDLHNLRLINPFGYLLCTVLGNLFVFSLSFIIQRYKPISNVLSYFGRNSLIIFTTHLDYHIVSFSIVVITMIFGNSIASNLMIFLLIVLVEVVLCFVINSTKFKYLWIFPDIVNLKKMKGEQI